MNTIEPPIVRSTGSRHVQPSSSQAAPPNVSRREPGSVQRILVPVDFSECSMQALRYAVRLARQIKARVTLLHVVQLDPPISEISPADEAIIRTAEKRLRSLQHEAGLRLGHPSVRAGHPCAEIVKAAHEMHTDLIILSTHGRTGLRRFLLGSTAEQVVRLAGCPVLVVRGMDPSRPGSAD